MLASCATTPKNHDSVATAPYRVWRGKVLVHDKAKDSNHTIYLDVLAKRPRTLRLDISALMGIYVGSFVSHDSEMEMLLAREKRFISGPANANSMRELIKIQLDPMALLDLFWDLPFPKSDWVCEMDSQDRPAKCVQKSLNITVEFKERNSDNRLVLISTPNVEAQMSLAEGEPLQEAKPDAFKLTAPDGFRVQRLEQ